MDPIIIIEKKQIKSLLIIILWAWILHISSNNFEWKCSMHLEDRKLTL